MTSNPYANQFREVAQIYDELMEGIAYDVWLNYLKQLWGLYRLTPKSVLDVACGTGNMSFRIAREGIRVVGVDYSEAMIEVACRKLGNAAIESKNPLEHNPAFLCQSAGEIDLPERFDCAVSLFDSLNYITDYDELKRAFRQVYLHLNPEGFFIFDVNTRYALEKGFFDQDNLSSGRYPKYVWRSNWDEQKRLCVVEMDFETLGETGVQEFHETHIQRAYTKEELQDGLTQAGFSHPRFFHAYTLRPPGKRSDRWYVLCQKT